MQNTTGNLYKNTHGVSFQWRKLEGKISLASWMNSKRDSEESKRIRV